MVLLPMFVPKRMWTCQLGNLRDVLWTKRIDMGLKWFVLETNAQNFSQFEINMSSSCHDLTIISKFPTFGNCTSRKLRHSENISQNSFPRSFTLNGIEPFNIRTYFDFYIHI